MENFCVPLFDFTHQTDQIQAISYTSEILIYSSADQTIRFYNFHKKKITHVLHSLNKNNSFLSSNELFLMAGDPSGHIEIWNLGTYTRVSRERVFSHKMTTACISPLENAVIASGVAGEYLVKKIEIDKQGRLKEKLEFDIEEEISHLAISTSSKQIYALGEQDVIQLACKSLKFHNEQKQENIYGLFNSDLHQNLIGLFPDKVKIWQSKKFKDAGGIMVNKKTFPQGIIHARFDEVNRILVVSDQTQIHVWDLNTAKMLYKYSLKPIGKIKDQITCIEISSTNNALIVGSLHALIILELSSGKLLKSIQRTSEKKLIRGKYQYSDISEDGSLLAGIRNHGSSEIIEIWDLTSKNMKFEMKPKDENNHYSCIKIAPDKSFLATGDESKTTGAKLWDLKKGTLVKSLKEIDYGVKSIHITPDSSYLISSDATFDIEVFQSKTGKLEKRLSSSTKNVTSFAMTTDQQYLACSYYDIMDTSSDIKIFDFNSGEVVKEIKAKISSVDKIIQVEISKDDKYIYARSMNGKKFKYELMTGKEKQSSTTKMERMIPEESMYSYPVGENIVITLPNLKIPATIRDLYEQAIAKNGWIAIAADSYALKEEVDEETLHLIQTSR
ncbi:MAG: hypothetical protein INQ03_17025 [Candidatus Heimdallarchaeota archaeon]|nr:hypothetical protein [Candidatus Heimdallarchaeota archaeon]